VQETILCPGVKKKVGLIGRSAAAKIGSKGGRAPDLRNRSGWCSQEERGGGRLFQGKEKWASLGFNTGIRKATKQNQTTYKRGTGLLAGRTTSGA